MDKRRIGALGEDAACQFLVKSGFKIIERNYRRKWGEIDIIAEKEDQVRFVEVKTISREISALNVSREMSHQPEDMVDRRKLTKLARTANLYMEGNRDNREFQIDVVAVLIDVRRRIARCRLTEQALEDNV